MRKEWINTVRSSTKSENIKKYQNISYNNTKKNMPEEFSSRLMKLKGEDKTITHTDRTAKMEKEF